MNWYDFNNDEKMIEKIKELDQNDDLYLEMINQPVVKDFEKSHFNLDYSMDFLRKIVEGL